MTRRIVVVAVLSALITAVPVPAAGAGTLQGSSERDPFCGVTHHSVTFTASSGERNNVTVGHFHDSETNPLEPFPECSFITVGIFTFADPTATIRPSGGCRFVVGFTNRLARCPSGSFDISLGDMNDTLVVAGGLGEVSCGPGRDTVIAGEPIIEGDGPWSPRVWVAPDCETVLPPR